MYKLYICINSYTFRSNDFLKKLYESSSPRWRLARGVATLANNNRVAMSPEATRRLMRPWREREREKREKRESERESERERDER